MRLSAIIALLSAALILVGCKADYDRGFRDGLKAAPKEVMEEARESGYQKGYEDGFKEAYPGLPLVTRAPYSSLYKLLVWGGLLKIVLTLIFVNFAVIYSGDDGMQVLEKAVYSGLGIGAAIFLLAIAPEARRALDLLLIAAPRHTLLNVMIASVSAVIGYYFIRFWLKFVLKDHAPVLLGWCAFLLSAVLTLLIRLFFAFYYRVPDMTSYASSIVFCGMLIGALYFVADSLLRRTDDVKKFLRLEHKDAS